jgi:acetylornithine deacetylase/succinyl-diaminopimelate desuccinylase-like protein
VGQIGELTVSSQLLEQVRAHRTRFAWRIIADFAALLALDNVTMDLPALRRNAAAVAEAFAAIGARMEVIEHAGAAPIVVGRLGANSELPTLGVYVHYDGQPVGTGGWRTPPFEPTLYRSDGRVVRLPREGDPIDEDWRLFARASADDKAPLIALLAAVNAVRAAGVSPTVNLVFCFEGEEESGSPNLKNYLEAVRDRLGADAWLICDGPVHQSGAPQIVLGARGYCGFDLTVYGPSHEIHSGHYGNWAPNPALDLAHLLATCKNRDGTVTIDGFYDDTQPCSSAEQALLDALPPVEATLPGQLGVAQAETAGSRLTDRLMLPSFNIRGLAAADIAPAARNVIPAEATASVDIRLAAGDRPKQMLRRVRDHIQRQGFHILERPPTPVERRQHRRLARLDARPGYPATRTRADLPIVAHLNKIASRAAGQPAFTIPTLGGSLPLHDIAEILAAPTIIMPIANADNNQHAANENLRLGHLWYGIDLWSLLLTTKWQPPARTPPA